jgi:L-lactate dehydrogenase complex protein LldG
MTATREKILSAIRQNKPSLLPEPSLPIFGASTETIDELVKNFSTVLASIGGKAIEVESVEELPGHLMELFGEVSQRTTTIEALEDWATVGWQIPDPHDLALIDVAVLTAELGVAENAALWVSESHAGHRVLPFIAQYLVLVLSRKQLVATMHQAYGRVEVNQTGWGCFIAGPSKTADIEQSLVIGAHGARGLTVFLLP